MLCCYFDAARCCRALGFYHVQQLHLRIDRFLLATYRPTEDPGEFYFLLFTDHTFSCESCLHA